MIEAELPDGRVLEFPDGTNPSVIQATVKKMLASAPKQAAPEPTPTNQKALYEETAEEMPWYQQAAAGAGGAVKGMSIGARQLFGDVPEQEVKDYQSAMSGLRGTGGGIVGEIFANILPGMGAFKAASAIPKVAGAIAGGGKVAGATIAGIGGATGAAEGALVPTTADESRGFNTAIGGTVGAVAPAVVGAVGKVGQKIVEKSAPFFSKEARQVSGGQMLRDVAGNKADNIMDRLRISQPVISGQTAGQATVGAASPEFAVMQKIVNDLSPDKPFAKELAQRGARVDEIRSFAKTELDLQKAVNTRSAEGAANYQKALTNTVKWDADLGDIFKNPYVRDTLPTVRKLVQARKASGENVPLAEQLQMIKKELDTTIAGTPMNKPSDNTAKAVMGVQDKLTNWMTTKLPGYDKAISDYATASKPINEMKIGQKAIETLEKPLGSKESSAAFAKAVADEKALIKSTGFGRAELDDLLSPQNSRKLRNVVEELNINAKFDELAERGLKAERVKSVVGDVVELPNALNQAVTLANTALRKFTGGAKVKTLKELAEIMQDPKLTAEVMKKASQREANAIKFLIGAQKAGAIVGTGTNRSYQ